MAKKDYSKLSKEELLEVIKNLESKKKYGLVWDEEKVPEKVVLDCQKQLPVLKEVKEKEIVTDPNQPTHILIEGDNYHALSVLNYTHKGKIDLIYIDPPYNRGGDFIYNDCYVEKEDSWRHSKWLNFMNKRLELAKELLTENGVIYISIDDAQFANLLLICNQIFDESKVETFIWRKSGFGRDGKMKNTQTFRVDHEYIIVCYKEIKKLNKIKEIPNFQNEYGNPDKDPRGSYKAGSISRKEIASNPNHKNYYTVTSPSGKTFTRQFDIEKSEFERLDKDIMLNNDGLSVSRIYWGKKGDAVPALKIFVEEEREITPYSVLLENGTTTEGTKQVSEILDKDCSLMRPKPTKLIQTLIQLGVKNENGIVLDFFAGTGTTAHSVITYNQKFKQNLRFIICTNNNENICYDYCYPRIKNVFKGFTSNQDFASNEAVSASLKYFKTAFVKNRPNKDQLKIEITKQCTEMLCLKEGIFNLKITTENYKIFEQNNSKENRYMAIFYDFANASLEELKNEMNNLKGNKILYCFTLQEKLETINFKGWKDIQLESIPQKILDLYLEIFKN